MDLRSWWASFFSFQYFYGFLPTEYVRRTVQCTILDEYFYNNTDNQGSYLAALSASNYSVPRESVSGAYLATNPVSDFSSDSGLPGSGRSFAPAHDPTPMTSCTVPYRIALIPMQPV